jgi:chemotaxis protein MotA
MSIGEASFHDAAESAAVSAARPARAGAAAAGLLAGLATLLAAVALGGSPGAFFDLPSLLIVGGGTLAAVVVCFSPREVAASLRIVAGAVPGAAPDPQAAATTILRLAVDARRSGPLHLEGRLVFAPPTFLRKALALLADGAAEEDLETVLGHELRAAPLRYRSSAAVLRRAADCAPAMGLIGTLIGLVQMLGRLNEPQHLGPSMAMALLTTLYGAVLAHMVLLPLAVKLERAGSDEELICRIYLLGAISIGRRENPRRLEILLNSLLPPGERVTCFD